ncbi:MAG: hypothetical protein ACOCPA_00600 [Segatella copri]
MDKVKTIKNYLQNQKKEWMLYQSSEAKYRMEAYTELLDFINSIQEEPVSEDLGEAAKSYGDEKEKHAGCGTEFFTCELVKAFKDGAQWEEKQFEKNRLAACDAQTKKEADREWNFVEKMIKEEHRQPTYSDAIEYGIRLQKEQMMKGAIDATIEHKPNDYVEFIPCIHVKVDRLFKKVERVKVIIMKEE